MLELIRPNTNIDFFRLRPWAFAFSGALTVIGMVVLLLRGGPNFGIDFEGGIMLHVGVDASVGIAEMRSAVDNMGLGEGGASVQEFGNQPGEYLLRVASADDKLSGGRADTIKKALSERFAAKNFRELRTEIVGPRVGNELRRRALLSVLFATVMMAVYIAFRFDLRFGVGAAVALIHDVLVAISALAIFNMEVDLTIVAALLTIVGYSVNDTVVVSDRIRENIHRYQKDGVKVLINRSLNETLSRTILTGTSTIMVCVTLFFFGGGVIHGFAFTLLVGILTGTYSSIFIAAPIVEMWKGGATLGVEKA